MTSTTRSLTLTLLLAVPASAPAGQSPPRPEGGPAQERPGPAEGDREYATALALFKRGEDEEAAAAAKRALESRERLDGRDGSSTVQALLLLASIYRLTGRGEQAEPLYRRAVSILEKRSDARPSDYAAALEGYSCLLLRRGRDEEAEKYGRRARDLIGRLERGSTPSPSGLTLTMSDAVLDRTAVDKPQPPTASAAPDAVGGTVKVGVTVDESGNVTLACAQSGPASLWEASERAAYGWRFRPTLLNGEPVKVRGSISFKFEPR